MHLNKSKVCQVLILAILVLGLQNYCLAQTLPPPPAPVVKPATPEERLAAAEKELAEARAQVSALQAQIKAPAVAGVNLSDQDLAKIAEMLRSNPPVAAADFGVPVADPAQGLQPQPAAPLPGKPYAFASVEDGRLVATATTPNVSARGDVSPNGAVLQIEDHARPGQVPKGASRMPAGQNLVNSGTAYNVTTGDNCTVYVGAQPPPRRPVARKAAVRRAMNIGARGGCFTAGAGPGGVMRVAPYPVHDIAMNARNAILAQAYQEAIDPQPEVVYYDDN